MNPFVLDIAKDFSRKPAGRYVTDGPYSGEAFREQMLWPAIKDNDVVNIVLDGALGFGSSFLEEAFGGLVREHGLTLEKLKAKVKFVTSIKTYENRIWSYVEDASKAKKR